MDGEVLHVVPLAGLRDVFVLEADQKCPVISKGCQSGWVLCWLSPALLVVGDATWIEGDVACSCW